MYQLVIAEKPSVAQSLAAVLGAGQRREGYLEGNGWLVSWCVGHLAELADAAAYNPAYAKWRKEDLPILPESWRFTIAKDKRDQFDVLRTLLRREDVSEVVNACDAGREGELIFRTVIGDDEHGWDDEGVFNFEGGCYAKVINLDKESEPDIWNAIKRDALLENCTVNAEGEINFADKSVTENTRVSYPIYHIENIVKPVSKGPHAKQVIFLSADAFGVLPPVSILNPEQTQYYFLSGFTAKLAGTERGITEPTPTFSACFGAAFLSLHPTKYGEELVKKMKKAGAKAYLVNTGWNGSGKRISIKDTRGIIDAILDGSIDKAPTKVMPYFDFVVPTELPGVDPKILDPRDTYECACQWEEKAKDLAGRFIKNFAKFTGNEAGKALVAAGPKL